MTILDSILENKRIEIEERKKITQIKVLEKSSFFEKKPLSLKTNLLNSQTGIIAEFKRKSPSKGWINQLATVTSVVKGYELYGASGISILADNKYFAGSPDDIRYVREMINTPILFKEFIVDEYQIYEAKSVGADVILLIAAALTKDEVLKLSSTAHTLGMEVLLEIHSAEEVKYICNNVDMVGVNNRNLNTFDTNVETSLLLGKYIPDSVVKIAESGISDTETVSLLRTAGFRGFLMGENFMKEMQPPLALKNFIEKLRL